MGKSIQGMPPQGRQECRKHKLGTARAAGGTVGIPHWEGRCGDRQRKMPMSGSLAAWSKKACSWMEFIGRIILRERKVGSRMAGES